VLTAGGILGAQLVCGRLQRRSTDGSNEGAPRGAMTPGGVSVLRELSKVDGSYCAMPNKRRQRRGAIPRPLRAPERKGPFFAHARLYRLHLDQTGDPDPKPISRLENIPGEPVAVRLRALRKCSSRRESSG